MKIMWAIKTPSKKTLLLGKHHCFNYDIFCTFQCDRCHFSILYSRSCRHRSYIRPFLSSSLLLSWCLHRIKNQLYISSEMRFQLHRDTISQRISLQPTLSLPPRCRSNSNLDKSGRGIYQKWRYNLHCQASLSTWTAPNSRSNSQKVEVAEMAEIFSVCLTKHGPEFLQNKQDSR